MSALLARRPQSEVDQRDCLIADMLEALRMAHAWIMEYRDAGRSDATLRQIRSAIAKAAGEQS